MTDKIGGIYYGEKRTAVYFKGDNFGADIFYGETCFCEPLYGN